MKIVFAFAVHVALRAVIDTDAFGIVPSRAPAPAKKSPLFWKATVQTPCLLSSDKMSFQCSEQRLLRHDPLRSTNSNEPEDVGIERSGMTLMERIDSAGMKLKPAAMEAKEQSIAAKDDRFKRILLTSKACILFTLFALYRAYRGFFVLLPAVFREVYAKMETAVQAPFVDEAELDENNRDVDPATGTVRFRTRFTVSVLAAIVTASYVITGIGRVVMKMFQTLTSTSSVKDSFEAAADEVLANEEAIENMTKKRKVNGED